MSHLRSLATVLLAASLAGPAVGQVTGMRGLGDHAGCCALGLPNLHGIDGTFEPAPDPVLSRHRAPAPPRPAAVPESAPGNASARAAGAEDSGATAAGAPTPPADGGVASPGLETAETAEAPVEYPPLREPTRKVEGYWDVGFETLGGYAFSLTKAEAAAFGSGEAAAKGRLEEQIPEIVRKLDGQRIVISGFMLPMKMEGAVATEFLLVANSMLCCYGVVPPMNQWVTVKMRRRGVPPRQDVPIQVFGTLRVQPRVENRALSAIYHLDADRVK